MSEASRHDAERLGDSLRDYWAEILEVPREEVNDCSHFFESGGDSLLAVELVAGLSEMIGVAVPLDSIMLDGTFGGLRDVCEGLLVTDDVPSPER